MEQSKPKIVKVSLDNDMRRIALNANDFGSLVKQIAELFSLDLGTFSVKYKDDEGDMITLCSNEEFNEALNCCNDNILRLTVIKNDEGKQNHHGGRRCWRRRFRESQNNNNNNNNNEKEEKQEQQENNGGRRGRCGWWRRHHQHGQHHNPLFGMVGPFIQQMAGNLIEGGNFDGILSNLLNSDACKLEHDHVCDGCDTQISGTRYHCANCEDFDFCSTCFKEKRNSHNETHQFEEITAVQALKDALKNKNVFIDAFMAPGKSSDPVEKKVHHAFCDRCDQKIVGIRWKCFECEDFDFCNSCYLEAVGKEDVKNHKKEHSFAKIDEPQQINSFASLKEEFDNKKNEENKRNEFLAKIEEKKRQEEEVILKLEKEKKSD